MKACSRPSSSSRSSSWSAPLPGNRQGADPRWLRVREEHRVAREGRLRRARARGVGLFNHLDGLESEGEFRGAVALPLVGLALVFSIKTAAWWSWLTLLVPVALIIGGVITTQQAERALVDLVLDHQTRLPFLDASERQVATETEPADISEWPQLSARSSGHRMRVA